MFCNHIYFILILDGFVFRFSPGSKRRERNRRYISPAILTDKLGEFHTFFLCIESAVRTLANCVYTRHLLPTIRGLNAYFCVFFLTHRLHKSTSGVDNKHPPLHTLDSLEASL